MKTTYRNLAALVVCMIFSTSTYAYDVLTDENDLIDAGLIENKASTPPPDLGGDPGVAPINDYLPLLLLGGIALGFVYTRKRRTNTI